MKVHLVLLVLTFMFISQNVEGKAVVKRTKYPGYSHSLEPQYNTQWTGAQQKTAAGMFTHKTSATGESSHLSYLSSPKVDEYAGKSNSNLNYGTSYDLGGYENLEQMFDSDVASQDLINFEDAQQKPREESLDSNASNLKENFGPLESDEVFLHRKDQKTKHSSKKVKPGSPESYLTSGDSKGKKNKSPSINEIQPKGNAVPLESALQSKISTTLPTTLQQFVTEHPSNKLGLDSDFVSIPSELIQDSTQSLELVQRNILLEDESDILKLTGGEDLKTEVETQPISSNFAPNLHENRFSDNFDSVIDNEDKNLFKIGINHMFDANFDSFVFNPNAGPLEKFQECTTPRNESGFCRYVQHCMLPSILNSIQHFMENVCIIQQRFIGVCCPEFPVSSVSVKWEDQPENFNDDDNSVEIPEDCGIGTNTRIVGGNDADRKAWPWMVALLNSKKKFFCGGSLVNNKYVLTAAHCTFGPSKNQIIARLGEYDFNDPRDPHDDYRVIEVKRHGQYNGASLRNDIALLKLEKPVVFNEFVKTICFPESVNKYIGNVTTLVGWGHLNGGSGGSSDVLQEASFPVISNEQCSRTHRVPVPSSLICAAAVSRDKGACNGDSGGPLMLLDENNHWKVIGIVSWGRRGCNPRFPTVYTRVTHYLDWIGKHSM